MQLRDEQMVIQLFMSHTKLDKNFCDRFDIMAARVGVKVFRSEFEKIKPPAWSTIKKRNGCFICHVPISRERIGKGSRSLR